MTICECKFGYIVEITGKQADEHEHKKRKGKEKSEQVVAVSDLSFLFCIFQLFVTSKIAANRCSLTGLRERKSVKERELS